MPWTCRIFVSCSCTWLLFAPRSGSPQVTTPPPLTYTANLRPRNRRCPGSLGEIQGSSTPKRKTHCQTFPEKKESPTQTISQKKSSFCVSPDFVAGQTSETRKPEQKPCLLPSSVFSTGQRKNKKKENKKAIGCHRVQENAFLEAAISTPCATASIVSPSWRGIGRPPEGNQLVYLSRPTAVGFLQKRRPLQRTQNKS